MSFTGCATADSQWLFLALGEANDPASMTLCADEDELLAAVKDAMYFTPEGDEMSADDLEHCKGIMAELIEDGCVTFEGDPGLHLYRVWKTREQALADVSGVSVGDASYVCPQCGPDPRGPDVHARERHEWPAAGVSVRGDGLTEEQESAEYMRWNLPGTDAALAFHALDTNTQVRQAFIDGLRRGAALGVGVSAPMVADLPGMAREGQIQAALDELSAPQSSGYVSRAIEHLRAALGVQGCATCGADRPFTGSCGTSPSDKRALCNQPGARGVRGCGE